VIHRKTWGSHQTFSFFEIAVVALYLFLAFLAPKLYRMSFTTFSSDVITIYFSSSMIVDDSRFKVYGCETQPKENVTIRVRCRADFICPRHLCLITPMCPDP